MATNWDFWKECAKRSRVGATAFANDWQWFTGVPLASGIGAFVATKQGVELTTGYPILDGVLAAFVAFLITWVVAFARNIYREAPKLYFEEKKRADDLADTIRPKLKCSFNMNDPGCVRPNTVLSPINLGQSSTSSIVTGGATVVVTGGQLAFASPKPQLSMTYYRIRVSADGTEHVIGCKGRLESIKKNGHLVVDGEPTTLPFKPAENDDATTKTIHGNTSEFLDFMYIDSDNNARITAHKFSGSSSVDWNGLFSDPAEYLISVKVLSSGPTAGIELSFKWTGKRETSEIVCLPN